MAARAVIVSGSGRYADPWHPFAATSVELAAVLSGDGFDVTVDEDVDGAMARLADVDVLVVNTGDPWRGAEATDAPPAAVAGLADALSRGIGVLAMHTAVASLRDYPDWAAAVGAVWLPEVSMHPPAGETVVSTRPATGVADFTVADERYCRLQRIGASDVIAQHPGARGGSEPTAWTRTYRRSRVAVDVLGHDAGSYASAGHRDLIRFLARWCAAG